MGSGFRRFPTQYKYCEVIRGLFYCFILWLSWVLTIMDRITYNDGYIRIIGSMQINVIQVNLISWSGITRKLVKFVTNYDFSVNIVKYIFLLPWFFTHPKNIVLLAGHLTFSKNHYEHNISHKDPVIEQLFIFKSNKRY